MEKAKQVGSSSSSSSSSFTVDLFGPKDSPIPSSSSSTGLFRTMFGPPVSSMVPERDTFQPGFGHTFYPNAKHEPVADYSKNGQRNKNEFECNEMSGKAKPCYFNSSIYYGGQEVYSSTTPNAATPARNVSLKEDGGEVDQNDTNSSCASRGNWWQGSLYY